jgi:8-oxo-dGTP diphosphatase
MKTVRVVAAIIVKGNSILATQRGYGEFAGGWEFPGGKIEEGETPEEAIVREIHEELKADIIVKRMVTNVVHDYDTFRLDMDCFLCTLKDESITLVEHKAARWLDRAHIATVDWLPADIKVVDALLEQGID